ncbi:MFS transporter [Aciditerrimonas ferrireducens]|uniref:MFS transporter n=1 Tax=Aciditerrimonas ferrireducens TaxID=667306 RepID=A0ABV6C2U3_9ACTN
MVDEEQPRSHRTTVPARLDRLPWSRFHWLVVVGLGVSWILDGLEIQIASSVSPVLQKRATLHLSTSQAAHIGTVYLVGEIVGALVFGRVTDRLGRKRLFTATLGLYLVASGITGLSPTLWFLLLFRFLAGMGIGGEYAAINSAIDELIPSAYRGRVDIAINGTYWGGAMIGSVASIFFFNRADFPVDLGWRLAFLIGPAIGLAIIYLRRYIPESPRWLMTHGRADEAERTVDEVEARLAAEGIELAPVDPSKAIEVTGEGRVSYLAVARTLLAEYPGRSFLGASMMITQSFLYNAIFFSYALVLTHFYKVPSSETGYYFFPFAAGNLLGPLLLGPLFDSVGRRRMITATYCLSGALLAVSGWLFDAGDLTALTQTIFWCVIFFFASAGASSAYLTVSEIFPLELRGQAIAVFFAVAQGAGAGATALFGALIGNGHHHGPLTAGYLLGAGVMILGGIVAWFFGVNAERTALEDVARPLSLVRPGASAVSAQSR